MADYSSFLNSVCGEAWKETGIQRRAGIMAPLFSIQSSQSVGVGELPDLEHLADWCRDCGMSLIQLLPLNDVGGRFCPYDAESSFALEPMHLSLSRLAECAAWKYSLDITALRKKFPPRTIRFDKRIKKEKMALLRKIFDGLPNKKSRAFEIFKQENKEWLEDYVLFKVIKEGMKDASWESWPIPLKHRDSEAMLRLGREKFSDLEFYRWVQWQLCRQFRKTAENVHKKGVLLLGDLPFLVARDSADVWAHPELFKLELSAGAPPDLYFAEGQEWGMPPYHWGAMAADGYDYMKQKMRYAANFYDLFRMDHFVGLLRVWVFPKTGGEDRKKQARFDPSDETLWEAQARQILGAILDKNPMLPCAEDLGVVPNQAKTILNEYAIPGMEIQRWMRNWETDVKFKNPQEYRPNSITTLSTHDMSALGIWWQWEAGTVEASFFKKKLAEKGLRFEDEAPKIFENTEGIHGRLRWKNSIRSVENLLEILGKGREDLWDIADLFRTSFDEREKYWEFLEFPGPPSAQASKQILEKAIERASQSLSVFCVHSIQDLLDLDGVFGQTDWEARFNQPGIVDEKNWTLRTPISLEQMRKLSAIQSLRKIHENTDRS